MTRKQLIRKAITSGVFSLLVLALVTVTTIGWFIDAGEADIESPIAAEIDPAVFGAEIYVQGQNGDARQLNVLASTATLIITEDDFYLTDFVTDAAGNTVFSWAPGYSGFTNILIKNNGTHPMDYNITLEDISFKMDYVESSAQADYIDAMYAAYGFMDPNYVENLPCEYMECYRGLSSSVTSIPEIWYDRNEDGLIDPDEYFDTNGDGMYTANPNLRAAINFNTPSWKIANRTWVRDTNKVFSNYIITNNEWPERNDISSHVAKSPEGGIPVGGNSGSIPVFFSWPYEAVSIQGASYSTDGADNAFLEKVLNDPSITIQIELKITMTLVQPS